MIYHCWYGSRVLGWHCSYSVAMSCPTLCDPMTCSKPGFPVLHHLPELFKLMSIETVMPSTHLVLCHPLSSCLQSFSASGSFLMSQLFTSGGQSIGASASASVLPMNIRGWFPLGLTGLISLLSKGLSRVFSNTTVQKHQFFCAQPSLWSNSHIHIWLLEKSQLWLYRPFFGKVMSLIFNTEDRWAIISDRSDEEEG